MTGPRRTTPGQILFYLPVAEMFIRELEDIPHDSRAGAAVLQWSQEKYIEQIQRLKV